MHQFTAYLDKQTKEERLEALSNLIKDGALGERKITEEVNNHIHTKYSFSPYTPTMAVVMAYSAGLSTAGIMDHDSISGAEEFIKAGELVGMSTTIGVECRASVSSTNLAGRRINNPDQNSVIYMALHGVPHTQIGKVTEFFAPYIEKRNERNKKMIENINTLFEPYGINIDFEGDVVPLSEYKNGGSITERHLLYALANKIIEKYGKGKACSDFFKNEMKLVLSQKIEDYLCDEENIHYAYDVLGLLKSDLISRIYIDATEECPDVKDVIAFSKQIGAISAYAYLGDVGNSVTGDKKAQKFEDDYIDLLFETISGLGFDAVTYMPSRNTKQQLSKIMELCDKFNLFQISGEDINSSRQKFICEKLREPEFRHLCDSTWALIGHERAATKDLNCGMFSEKSKNDYPDIKSRVEYFKKLGLEK
ncbi:MAG: PHP domain-containing protein [Ruminococcaceae bacterium]|nr:PHP domain-containing protein [Oscillospiraceae bacterium]